MSKYPPGFEFLDDPSNEWIAPAELLSPTKIPLVNLVIAILATDMTGNDVIQLLGDVLAEHASFNMWIAREGSSVVNFKTLGELSEKKSHITRDIYRAWLKFTTAHETGNRKAKASASEYNDLLAVLQDAKSRFQGLQVLEP